MYPRHSPSAFLCLERLFIRDLWSVGRPPRYCVCAWVMPIIDIVNDEVTDWMLVYELELIIGCVARYSRS